MNRLFPLLLLASCVLPDPEVGGRCKNDGVSDCDFGGTEALLCVGGRWESVETCEFGTEQCVKSQGEAVCSVDGEPCDTEGATKCSFAGDVLSCDGRAWQIYDSCDLGSCEVASGVASCE